MQIVIDPGFFLLTPAGQIYFQQITGSVRKEYPDAVFYLLINGKIQKPGWDVRVTGSQKDKKQNRLKEKLFNTVTFPAFCKKNKIDLLLSFANRKTNAAIPHFYITNDTGFLTDFSRLKGNEFILTQLPLIKKELEQNSPSYAPRVFQLSISSSSETIIHTTPVAETPGTYFLCHATGLPNDKFINLLKGFSFFKKRQQSSIRLVFTIDEAARESFEKNIKTYKYKEDVILHSALTPGGYAELVKNAYAFILPSGTLLPSACLFVSLQQSVPVISDLLFFDEQEDRVLPLNESRPEQAGEALSKLYRDESFRATLIRNSSQFLAKTTGTGWEVLGSILSGHSVN